MTTLHALAQLAGIQPVYQDIWGKDHNVPDSTLVILLNALGYAAASEDERAQSRQRLDESHHLPPVQVISADRKTILPVLQATQWELTAEDGQQWQDDVIRDTITLPALKAGYYQLHVTLRQGKSETRLIVAPAHCWMPDNMREQALDQRKRVWGMATQLYGLRSSRNWGIGDFSDLALLAQRTAHDGADVLGVNPLHANFPGNPQHFSPYSPSSRLFLNSMALDVEAIDGFAGCSGAQQLWQDPDFQQQRNSARNAELVNYSQVAALKRPVLEALFAHSSTPEAFTQFREQQGEQLEQQVLFDALSERFGPDWHAWPEAYRQSRSKGVADFAREHATRISFFAWLQWQADKQLAHVQQTARQHGMKLGLYRDLAVGPDKAGAEMWLHTDGFIQGVSVGAPPDEYNPKGQNWGLPPLHPRKLRENGYQPFINLLRANMRHAGALRIDHAFGLSRLYLIPDGEGADKGAYVHYAFDDMLAILRVESHRNRCIVIGEDLGTFPPGYKESAAESGVLSYKVFYFERDETGGFTPPTRYAAQALATLSTHDLPTLAGWQRGEDMDEREKLRLYPSQELLAKDRAKREEDKPLLQKALQQQALNADDPLAVQRYLARSPAAMVMVQMEDVLQVPIQANLPGTTTERPNWRMKLPESLEEIDAGGKLAALAGAMNAERAHALAQPPRATYRLQFHKDFTFYDAAEAIPYLAKLGISHVYASPYLQARPGSTHGYDITDHHALNPELGGEEGYRAFTEALREHGLKQILDFPPNHMGVGGADNRWWLSTLEWGQDSPYAAYFDIDWNPRYPGGKPQLVLPFLGNHYGDVLAAGELQIKFDPAEGSFSAWYFSHRFPICPRDYHLIDASIARIQQYEDGEALKTALREKGDFKPALDTINADMETVHALLDQQHYRLSFWRVAANDINYRRFFDINDLAGMRVEHADLFDTMHELVLKLVREGSLHGLRIDHIDGLADPQEYCRRLREKTGAACYLTVEKILASHEVLPQDWGIDGTSGYDALNLINALFVNTRKQREMDTIYRRFTGISETLEHMVYQAKCSMLDTAFASELQTLGMQLKRIADKNRYNRDYPLDTLKQALKDIIGHFPVYRAYATARGISEQDEKMIDWAIGKAQHASKLPEQSVYGFISELLALETTNPDNDILRFVRKFQQLSGPVMAKGLEDTSFYRYFRLISLNEVGGDPGRYGLSAKAFHQINQQRLKQLPHSMLATATHDTKRGEDARMRVSLLSDIPRDWASMLVRWSKFNRSHHAVVNDAKAPSRNEEYFIYQTLLGSWPVELLQFPLDAPAIKAYGERVKAYLTKALREGKLHSSWTKPDEAYEAAVHAFVDAVLDSEKTNLFLEDFLPIAARLAQLGTINSLSQTVLKLTLPGVPDIYQGTEWWDLSFVDPDNRRPVDYAQRMRALHDGEPLSALFAQWPDGRVKQLLIHQLLQHRAQHADLYAYGTYEPLAASGGQARHILAFSRQYKDERLIAIIPTQIGQWPWPWDDAQWRDTTIKLPENGQYRNLLTGAVHHMNTVEITELFSELPLAVLEKADAQ